jgi:hypothetical protein
MKKTIFVSIILALSILLFSGTQSLTRAGTISGKIVDSSGTQGLADVLIDVVDNISAGFVTWGMTNSVGYFSLGDLPAGKYKLIMGPLDFGQNYLAPIWYYNKDSFTAATVVDVPDQGQIVLNDQQLRIGGKVTGVVKGLSGPLAGVFVAQWDDSMNNYYVGDWTDDSGRYSLTLPVGSWKIIFDPWFISGNYDNYFYQFYNGVYGPAEALLVPVAENTTTELEDAQLGPMVMGTISGRVTDRDTRGIQNVEVRVRNTVSGFNYSVSTGADGYYSVEAPPGDYKVMFNPPPDIGNYVSEWYQGTNNPNMAKLVYVAPGQPTPDIDARLDPVNRVQSMDIGVYNDALIASFYPSPGFKNLVQSATLNGPNGYYYNFNLQSDTLDWLTECRYLSGWSKSLGTNFLYGDYTLSVMYYDGLTETYSKTLTQTTVEPVATGSVTVVVKTDGGADVSWSLPENNQGKYYQVRVKSFDGKTEYFSSNQITGMSVLIDQNSLSIPSSYLRCLEENETYRWIIRVHDGDPSITNFGVNVYNTIKNSYITQSYNPGIPGMRAQREVARDNNGRLEIGFDVRSGLRNNVTQAKVTGPNFSYEYDLVNDRIDLSTTTSFIKGWDHFDAPWDYGVYTFTINYDDDENGVVDHTDTFTKTLNSATVLPVDPTTMMATVFPNGMVRFEWALPVGAANQYYAVRLRSSDGTKEYYNSGLLKDQGYVNTSFNSLRGLEQAKTYKWFIVVLDQSVDRLSNTARETEKKEFFYNPFNVDYRTLAVTKIGNGRVTSSTMGIDCGPYCQDTFVKGLPVTLIPTPDSGYAFIGWGGDCSGTGTCTVTMDTARAVTANFDINTPSSGAPGEDVIVNPIEPETSTTPVEIIFDSVTAPGSTYLDVTETIPDPPSGFQLGETPTYYEITTTATYSGPIEVCIDYTDISYLDENNLKLFHYEGNEWVDRTTSLDTVNNVICGIVEGFSAFAVFEKEDDSSPCAPFNLEATPNPVPVNTSIALNATLADNGSKIKWAQYSLDGEATWVPMLPVDGAFDSRTENVTALIGPFTTPGVHEVCVKGIDAWFNLGEKTCIFVVAYDPEGGFVTGGGWISSPLGAYAPSPSLTGKATFGFVSKYKKGAKVPTGETEFQFKVANFNFHSESYEWLVVAGPKAQYKGVGTINGTGEYGFMLTAIDGQINGGHGVDKFRIKIWDKATDEIIYDNQMGASDTGDPTTALGGGSIVIHKE